VLTTNVFEAFRTFCTAEGLEPEAIPHLLVEDGAVLADLHALELGLLADQEFERRFATKLGVDPADLLGRILAALRPDEPMIDSVRAARASGVPIALVSNSWGLGMYPFALLDELADVRLISAEIGLRKPDPAIFRVAAERLGRAPEECVVVDDLRPNVLAAEELGMTGLLHRGAEQTIAELERLLRVILRPS
jgi:putative hydrolase of the HAD superfamily